MTLYLNATYVPDFKIWTFPGGEVGVTKNADRFNESKLVARLSSANDILALVLAVDILKRGGNRPTDLYIPYLPYGRQDRVTESNGAFALQAIAQIIDNLGFTNIHTLDPHSYASAAVFTKSNLIEHDTIHLLKELVDYSTVLIAPDQGAIKRVEKAALKYNLPYLSCTKQRNGDKVTVEAPSVVELLKYKKAIVYDDICDGGATFVAVANTINTALTKVASKDKHPQLELFVTHGIFSKNLTPFNGLYTKIYTTNSWQEFGASWFQWNGGLFKVFDVIQTPLK